MFRGVRVPAADGGILILLARSNDYNRGAVKGRAPCRSGKSSEFRREDTALRLTPLVLLTVLGIAQAGARDETQPGAVAALLKAYPDFLERIDGNELVWKDGTRQRIDDGKAAKTFEAMLDDPDIKDMFAMTYPAGDKGLAPALNFDPGRIRYMPLFLKMYGDCRNANIAPSADVVWLRSKYGKTVKLAKINGAAAISIPIPSPCALRRFVPAIGRQL